MKQFLPFYKLAFWLRSLFYICFLLSKMPALSFALHLCPMCIDVVICTYIDVLTKL